MKAIIYAGVGLLTAASVYGVVNYYHAKKEGTFNHLYKDEAVVKNTNTQFDSAKKVNVNSDSAEYIPTSADNDSQKKKFRPRIQLEDFSRGRIDYVRRRPMIVKDSEYVKPVVEDEEKVDSSKAVADTGRSN